MHLLSFFLTVIGKEVLLQKIYFQGPRQLFLTALVVTVDAILDPSIRRITRSLEMPEHVDHGFFDQGVLVLRAFIELALNKHLSVITADVNIFDPFDNN